MREHFQLTVQEHAARYPKMAPQDYGKLAFQSEFGPEHLIPDPEQTLPHLLTEWQSIPVHLPPISPESIGNGLYRFPLDCRYDPAEAAPLLAQLFFRTAQEHHGTQEGLQQRLLSLQALAVSGMAEWLAAYRSQGCPPVHHSRAFREAYQPHYRLLSAAYAGYFPALLAVWRLAQAGSPAIIAIDGRCGSGKTHLAALIAQLFSCNVFHTDDFYLPLAERADDWAQGFGGNMNFARLLQEVIRPAQANAPVRYRPFDCQHNRLRSTVVCPPLPLTIVEGSYSQHPQLAIPYDLKIFLTCSAQEQSRRLQAREGDYYPAFQTHWIPMEERYLHSCSIAQHSHLTLDTSHFPR